MNKRRIRHFLLPLPLLLSIGTAWSEIVPVLNPSFETLPAGGLSVSDTRGPYSPQGSPIPDWVTSGLTGQWAPNGAILGPDPGAGTVVAYSNGGTISQVVGPTVVAGGIYTLTVDIGARTDVPSLGLAVLVIGGSTLVPATGVPATAPGWSTYTATFTGTATTAGDSIGILLNSNGVQGDFDNVKLTATGTAAVPEAGAATIYGALAAGLIGLVGFTRRRKIA